MPTPLRVLILEDRPADAELILHALRQAGFDPDWQRVETEADYLARLDSAPDIILADYTLPQFDAMRALRLLQERGLDIPFIVATGSISEEVAVECIKQGAADYLLKDRLARLGEAVRHALQEKRLRDEKQRAEEVLRESEERFRALIENSSDGIMLLDADGVLLYASPATSRILGYALDALVGQNALELVHPDDVQNTAHVLADLRQKPNEIATGEFRCRHKDGSWRWIEAVGNNLLAEPSVGAIIVNYRDITERKQAEEALRETEARYRSIVERLPGIAYIAEHGEAGVWHYVSPQIEKMLGYTQEEWLADPNLWFQLLSPDDREWVLADDNEDWECGSSKPEAPEYRLIARDGRTIWVRDEASIFLNDSGRPKLWQGVLYDITERKQAEEALRQSEERFRALIENATDLIIVLNPDGTGRYISPSVERILGFRPDELIGTSIADFIHPDDLPDALEAIAIRLQTPGLADRSSDFRIRHKDGSYRMMEVIGNNLLDNPAVNGIVVNARDITERKQAEEQIQKQVETLTALYDLSRTLAEMEDFDAILDLLARRAVEAIHVTFARVLLLENGDLVARAVFPVRVLGHDLQAGQREPLAAHPFCQRVLEGNAPRVLQLDGPEAGDCAPFFLGIAQTLCVIPLRARERPLGLLMLGEVRDAAREPFTADKIHLAHNIGDQAASTLHRALLHEETQRRLQNIEALRAIDHAISSSLDLRLTLNVALEQTINQLGVDAAAVLLLNPHNQTLEYAAGRGFRGKAIERTRLRLGEGHAGRAALERRVVHIPNLLATGRDFSRANLLAGEDFECYHAAPLIAKGQVKGVLEVFHRAPLSPSDDWLAFLEMLAEQAAIAVDSVQLFDGLQRSNLELVMAYDATIEGWSHAMDLRDKETEGHTLRVTDLTVKLARALGISEAEIVHIRRGALLHDMGKLGVPDSILHKPGKLSDEEWVIMRRHPQFAFDMLSPIAYLRPALDIPSCHHEKWDGSGYPRGLKGEQIPLAARIFAVVDVYDALTSDRPYRAAWPKEKVLAHIQAGAGSHFDARVVEAFLNFGF